MRGIENEEIRNKVKVAPTGYKMRETALRWFGHLRGASILP